MCERGSAGVEHVAITLLAAALVTALVAAVISAGTPTGTPELASALLRKQRCAVHHPDPCWRDPLTEAYGRRVAGAVRALAPAPAARPAADGTPLVGVDFRRCRRPSCAVPREGAEGHLTVSNRRTTAFTAIEDERRRGGIVAIDYWIYRPTLGWELVRRRASAAEIERQARTPLLDSQDPVLVPLETLLGRDEARFPPSEEPPWRGLVESRWGR